MDAPPPDIDHEWPGFPTWYGYVFAIEVVCLFALAVAWMKGWIG